MTATIFPIRPGIVLVVSQPRKGSRRSDRVERLPIYRTARGAVAARDKMIGAIWVRAGELIDSRRFSELDLAAERVGAGFDLIVAGRRRHG